MVPFFCFKANICCRKGKDRSCMDIEESSSDTKSKT